MVAILRAGGSRSTAASTYPLIARRRRRLTPTALWRLPSRRLPFFPIGNAGRRLLRGRGGQSHAGARPVLEPGLYRPAQRSAPLGSYRRQRRLRMTAVKTMCRSKKCVGIGCMSARASARRNSLRRLERGGRIDGDRRADPVEKRSGDTVIGANLTERARCDAPSVGADTLLAQIVNMVAQAQRAARQFKAAMAISPQSPPS